MENTFKKREAPSGANSSASTNKKRKLKNWYNTKATNKGVARISPGSQGIFVTCVLNKEAKAVGQVRDLFQEYAEEIYGETSEALTAPKQDEDADIEAEMGKEVADIEAPTAQPLFENITLNCQCVLFFKTRPPLDPRTFTQQIASTINTPSPLSGASRPSTPHILRLTPILATAHADLTGLETAARAALEPTFGHGIATTSADSADATEKEESRKGWRYAIRPSIRNHSKSLDNDIVIKTVAGIVAQWGGHKVNLKNWDWLIVVEILESMCGVGIVPTEYEALKRYNLAELRGRKGTGGGGTRPKDTAKHSAESVEARIEPKEHNRDDEKGEGFIAAHDSNPEANDG